MTGEPVTFSAAVLTVIICALAIWFGVPALFAFLLWVHRRPR